MTRKLNTTRLLLRPVRTRDIDEVQELFEDQEVRRLTLHPAVPAWLAYRYALAECDNPKAWAIQERVSKAICGTICTSQLEPAPYPAVGFELRRAFWNRGYTTEALGAFVAHLFETATVDNLSGLTFVENIAAQRVFEKVGFQNIGPATCKGHHCWLYQLQKTDFLERPTPTIAAMRMASAQADQQLGVAHRFVRQLGRMLGCA